MRKYDKKILPNIRVLVANSVRWSKLWTLSSRILVFRLLILYELEAVSSIRRHDKFYSTFTSYIHLHFVSFVVFE